MGLGRTIGPITLIAFAAMGASCGSGEAERTHAIPLLRGAAFTTVDSSIGGCLDSPNGINCNHYTYKTEVYINGGPIAAGLPDGRYYFAVMTPGSQHDGFLDGAVGNLSDVVGGGDTIERRTFDVVNHEIIPVDTSAGHHAWGTGPDGRFLIGLWPFDDTDNPGNVYILAICELGATRPSQCRFDEFKADLNPPPTPGCIKGDCDGGPGDLDSGLPDDKIHDELPDADLPGADAGTPDSGCDNELFLTHATTGCDDAGTQQIGQ